MNKCIDTNKKVITNKQKRNGKIEFLRFFCSITVMLFHCNQILIGKIPKNGYKLGLMPRGYIAVEFFFIVSGYLMAKSIKKSNLVKPKQDLGKGYARFMWGKLSSILPYHIISVVCMLIMDVITRQNGFKEEFKLFLDYIPCILLLHKVGIQYKNINGTEWYISAMLLAMAIIYPFCKKFYSTYARVAAPIITIFIYGWIFHDYHTLTSVSKWDVIGYRCFWRAIAGISLGIFAYECSQFIAREKWSQSEIRKLTILEFACFGVFCVFTLISVPKKYEIYVVFLLFILVVLAFSGITKGEKYFDNKVIYFLGRFSLPLYLMQLAPIRFAQRMFEGYPISLRLSGVLISILILALLCMVIGDKWMVSLRKSHFNQMLTRE